MPDAEPRVRVRFCFTNDDATLPLEQLAALHLKMTRLSPALSALLVAAARAHDVELHACHPFERWSEQDGVIGARVMSHPNAVFMAADHLREAI